MLGRSETTIASNNGGTHMVAGWNDADGFCGLPFGAACTPPPVPGLSGYSYSTDGGQTWFDGGAPPVFDGAMTRGDPWLDLGGHGNNTYFYANLAVNVSDAGSRGIIVHRGTFAGNTLIWYDGQIFDSPRNATSPGADFYDKEALAAAKDGSGAAYVTVTNFEETCDIPQWGWGTIEVWRTHDGGDTWLGPTIASPDQSFITDPNDPDCGAEGVLQQSSVPAVGPKGEVYVVWQYGPTFLASGTSTDADIVVARSLDGGRTFEAPIKMSTATTNWCTVASNIRPNMGDYIGATSGGNRVLGAWADGRNGVPDTFYAQGQSAGKAR